MLGLLAPGLRMGGGPAAVVVVVAPVIECTADFKVTHTCVIDFRVTHTSAVDFGEEPT
jgi:hypothetical protein